ncbi:MAG: hypothetical protein ABJN69_10365 [Hellea sp.]
MKTQQIITGLLLAVGALIAIRGAMTPDLNLLTFTVEDRRAYGNGYTDDRSVGVVRKLLREHPQVDTLVLKDMSGTKDGDRNIVLARDIRRRGLNTHLERNSRIASGAVDLFIAGKHRTLECGALIGVHSWSIGETVRISPGDMGGDSRQRLHEKFLSDMGIDPAFYAFTRAAAEPEDIHYMSTEEINRFGLTSEPLMCD